MAHQRRSGWQLFSENNGGIGAKIMKYHVAASILSAAEIEM